MSHVAERHESEPCVMSHRGMSNCTHMNTAYMRRRMSCVMPLNESHHAYDIIRIIYDNIYIKQ